MSLRTYCYRNEKEIFGAVLLIFLLAFSCIVLLQAPNFCSNPGCSSAQPGRLWSQELGFAPWCWWEIWGILQECGRCPGSGALLRSRRDVQLTVSILRNEMEKEEKYTARMETWDSTEFISLCRASNNILEGQPWEAFALDPFLLCPNLPSWQSWSWVGAFRISLCAGGWAALGVSALGSALSWSLIW